MCVVALCAMQRDLVHACYLALALLLFRKRTDIRRAAAAAGAEEEQQRAACEEGGGRGRSCLFRSFLLLLG